METRSVVFAFGLAITSFAPAIAATPIGTASIVTNVVTGTDGADSKRIVVGDQVFQDQRIMTGTKSSAQLLFRDESVLTLGPDASVVLSRWIYNPQKRNGEVVVTAVTGAFRFISGSAQKDAYKINTPVATIGIRGTIVHGLLLNGLLTFVVLEGSAEVCNLIQKCVIVQAGWYLITNGRDLPEPSKAGERVLEALTDPNSNLNTLFGGLQNVHPTLGTNNNAPGSVPPGVPPAEPPGGPPSNPPTSPQTGFPPVTTPSGFVPLGLQNPNNPNSQGLPNRDPATNLPPGLQKKK
ncbi:MAG: FecR domain-containing protein [Alphaproteobacteria bacterium]